MANIGGLPNLNNKRLSILQKQLNHSRKSMTIINDKLKEALDRVEKSVNKTKQSDSFRKWQKTIPVKNSLVEMKALKKVLKHRRESTTLEPLTTPRNGVYGGATLDSMKPEVKQIISERAPRQRRLRKVEEMKSVGYRDGKLVDYTDSLDKLNNVLSRPKGKHKRAPFHISQRRTLLVREHPLSGDDFRAPSSSESSSDDETDDFTLAESDKPRSASTDGARTLQLPPIRVAKGARRQSQQPLSDRSFPSKKSSDIPNLVRRISSFGPY